MVFHGIIIWNVCSIEGGILIKYIDEVFKAIDLLNSSFEYSPREGQENLMLDIAEAIHEKTVLMAEAGVGIGKSFAYLIPGLIYSKRLKVPLIVSSSSIQLTEQLIDDIKAVSKILSTDFTYVVGKGRTNYLCYARYKSMNKNTGIADIKDLSKYWNSDLVKGNNKKKWCVEKCTFNHCEYRASCDFFNMRQSLNARSTSSVDCIIVNHNLLVEDLKKKFILNQQGLIQQGHTIVLDEAHKFEDIVRDSFNIKINLKLLKTMEQQIKELKFDVNHNLKTLEQLYKLIEDFNVEFISHHAKESRYIIGNRLDIKELMSMKSKDVKRLLWELNDMKKELKYLDFNDSKERIYNDLDETISTVIEHFESIESESSVYWAIYEKSFDLKGFFLCSAPKEINKIIQKLLFENQRSVILTSATLGGGINIENNTNDNESYYEYQIKALGLPKTAIYSYPQRSPYDYEKNTIVYLPSTNIDVRNDSEFSEIGNEIIQLANLMNGRTLVLFTSKKQMELVYDGMLLQKNKFSWELLKQDDNRSVNKLKEEFISKKAVLLSTGTFWEGVNIKGSDLSCLIVVRLPYPVPDPVVRYKSSTNPTVFESEMIIKLKQGTGRLIRSENDLGVIALLDSRVKEKKNILKALPYVNVTEKIDEVEKFIDERMIQYLLNVRV